MPHQLKSHPRKNGKDSRACRITGRTLGLVRKYELMLCRQAFREQAEHIGFVKYRWTTVTIDKHELKLFWSQTQDSRQTQPLRRYATTTQLTISRVGKAEAGDHETAPMPSAENRPRLECQLPWQRQGLTLSFGLPSLPRTWPCASSLLRVMDKISKFDRLVFHFAYRILLLFLPLNFNNTKNKLYKLLAVHRLLNDELL